MEKKLNRKKAFFLLAALLCVFLFIPKNVKINLKLSQNIFDNNLMVQNGFEECKLKNVYENMYIGKCNVIRKWPSELKVHSIQPIDKDNVETINLYFGSIWIGGVDKESLCNENDGLHGTITYSETKIFVAAVFYTCVFLMVSLCIYRILCHFKFHQITFRIQREQIKLGYIALLYALSIFLLKSIVDKIKINNCEIFIMTIGLYLTLLIIYSIIKNFKLVTIASVGIFAGLYISINNMTAFLTVDERRAITEQVQLSTDILRHWELGSSRLNYIIMGSIWKVIGWFNYNNLIVDYKIGKLMHWLCGVLLIAFLTKVIVCGILHCDRKHIMCSRYVIIWFFTIISPTMLTTLKNYNYDLFAVTFGGMSVFILLNAFKKLDVHLARVAVCFSCLATLEKTIAEPIMVICMIMYVYIAILGEKRFVFKAIIETLKINIYICIISLTCNLYIQHILRNDWFPNYKLTNVIGPLLDLLNKVIGKIISDVNEEKALLLAFMANIFIVLLCAIMIHLLRGMYQKKKYRTSINRMIKVAAAVVFSTTIIGIVGTYIQKYTYFYPYYIQEKNVYMTFSSATAKIFHYNAFNRIQFYLKSCLAMLIVFVNAMPSYIVILLLTVLFWLRKPKKKMEMFLLGIIGIIGSVIPILYGIICMEPNPRYQNLYVIITTICVLVVFIDRIEVKLIPQISLYVGLVLSSIEVVAFGPAYTGFFPYWNLNHCQYNDIETGKMSIGWYGGWGEDIALAGEKIEDYIEEKQLDYNTVNMYMNYHGSWLNNKGYGVFFMPGSDYFETGNIDDLDINSFPSGENDFYVFVRWGCIAGMTDYTIPPDDYEPIMTIDRRGATEVWIYTGSQLKTYFQSILEK